MELRRFIIKRYSGLYDPVLDDSEDYYVPIQQEDYLQASDTTGQTHTINNEGRQNVECKNGDNGTKYTNTKDNFDIFEDQMRTNLKDAFVYIDIDDLPPSARFKLPISDEYDPEGRKMSKLQRLYQNILNRVSEQNKQEENYDRYTEEVRQDIIKKEIEREILRQNEMTKKETMYTSNIKQDWETIRDTATKIVEKSINKALSVAEIEQKSKIDKKVQFKSFEFKSNKETDEIKSQKETKLVKNVQMKDFENNKNKTFNKKETKRVTFNENENREFNSFPEEVNYSEAVNEENNSLTAEKRKLLTRLDIEKTIKPGTVRDRSEIFKKYNIIHDVVNKTDNKEMEQSSLKIKKIHDTRISNVKMAQQRVFNIGAKTILNIWRTTSSKSILKTFFSRITNVMSKFVTFKSLPCFTKHEERYMEHKNVINEKDFTKNIKAGELIKKHKLSGAKIAQIEGMKPEELTKKMNIVILELQRKSGMEEELDSKHIDEEDIEKEYYEEHNEYRSENETENDSQDTFYQSYTHYDHDMNQQNKYNIYETTKTQTMEIKEMKSEKRCSEYKTTKIDSNIINEEKNEMRADDGNIYYIAIVEAHVYTNKDAIFEEHLRRLSESRILIEAELTKINNAIETDKLNVYDESRKLSVASADIISDEEYSSLNVIETEPIKYIRCATDLEHVAKKIAVQNITQIIEPLIHMESNKYVSNKQAHTVFEMPMKSIAQTTDVSTEEHQMYFQAQVSVTQKSFMAVEEPEKPAIEITEISVDEDEAIELEELKMKVEIPQTTIETPIKSIAEISEVLTKEDEVVEIAVSKPKTVELQPTVDVTEKVVALVSEVFVDEANDILKTTKKTSNTTTETRKEAKMNIRQNIATEVSHVSIEETTNEKIIAEKPQFEQAKIAMSTNVATEVQDITAIEKQQETFVVSQIKGIKSESSMESFNFSVAETTQKFSMEPRNEAMEEIKTTNRKASLQIQELNATQSNIVYPEEPKQQHLEINDIAEKQPRALVEETNLTVAEILTTVPVETSNEIEVATATNQRAVIGITELKAAEMITVSTAESVQESLEIPQMVEKLPQTLLESCVLTLAEAQDMIPEGPKDEYFDVTPVHTQQTKILIEPTRLTIAQSLDVLPEGPKEGLLEVPKLIEKLPISEIESPRHAIAEIIAVIPEEPKDQTFTVAKTINQEARINIEELKAAETKIITFEETTSEKLVPEITKSMEKQVNVALVESTATMIAETTAVTVATEETFKYLDKKPVTANVRDVKLEIVDVSDDSRNVDDVDLNYTVKLPEDDKIDEVFTEVTITKQKTPPLEVFAEYEFNEKKKEESSIYESIKLLKRQRLEYSIDESCSYTTLIKDAEFNKRVEEELIKIMSSVENSKSIQNGDISTFSFSLSALTPLIEEYMFRIRGPSLRTFQHIEDVFEEATLRLKSKFQSSTVENFNASLTLILQDIATSHLESNIIDVELESMEYTSKLDQSLQYYESQNKSKFIETNVQESKQSLHTDVAVAHAATKQTLETGIDVTVLAIEDEPLIDVHSSRTAHKTKSSKTEVRDEAVIGKVDIEAIENDAYIAQSDENMEISMQSNLRTETYQQQQSHTKITNKVSISSADFEHRTNKSADSISKSVSLESDKKLAIKTDVMSDDTLETGSLSPPMTPPTPLTNEYMFRLDFPLPQISRYVPRDCSYSPENIKDDIILRNGLIPHIITRIERIIYSPPLPTPPASPERQIIPIYTKPGLKGGTSDEPRTNPIFFNYFG